MHKAHYHEGHHSYASIHSFQLWAEHYKIEIQPSYTKSRIWFGLNFQMHPPNPSNSKLAIRSWYYWFTHYVRGIFNDIDDPIAHYKQIQNITARYMLDQRKWIIGSNSFTLCILSAKENPFWYFYPWILSQSITTIICKFFMYDEKESEWRLSSQSFSWWHH